VSKLSPAMPLGGFEKTWNGFDIREHYHGELVSLACVSGRLIPRCNLTAGRVLIYQAAKFLMYWSVLSRLTFAARRLGLPLVQAPTISPLLS